MKFSEDLLKVERVAWPEFEQKKEVNSSHCLDDGQLNVIVKLSNLPKDKENRFKVEISVFYSGEQILKVFFSENRQL